MLPQWLCVHFTSSAAICQLSRSSSSIMDAVTVSAALAIVVDASQQAAMEALLQEREQLAMLAAHHESYLAQRHYVGTLQVPQHGRHMTWETAFNQRHNDLIDAHHVMRTALRAIQRGDSNTAEQYLTAEVGSDSEVEDADEEMSEADATDGESTAVGEDEEEEDMENDAEVDA